MPHDRDECREGRARAMDALRANGNESVAEVAPLVFDVWRRRS